MSNNPLVSVCLPVWNGEQFLRKAIESILNQSYSNWELIVCDDQSDDESAAIALDFRERDNRVIYMRNQQKLGLFENYNQCLRHTRGELIKPFAQDDLLMPTAIERLVHIMEQYNTCMLASCAKQVVDASGAKIETPELPFSEGLYHSNIIKLACLRSHYNLIGEPVTVILRKTAPLLYFNVNYCSLGDLEYWFRILKQGDYYFLNEPLVRFRKHTGSATWHLLYDLNWVLDFIRFGHEQKELLSQLDQTENEYLENTMKTLSFFIASLDSNRPNVDLELSGFREVIFHCMRTLASVEKERSFHKAQYEEIIASTSWKITHPLRLLKAKLTQPSN